MIRTELRDLSETEFRRCYAEAFEEVTAELLEELRKGEFPICSGQLLEDEVPKDLAARIEIHMEHQLEQARNAG